MTRAKTVDPLLHNVPIVDPMGRPTSQFARLWLQARTVDETVSANAESLTGLETGFEEHAAATTDVHGIADTSLLVLDDDPRLTDARIPLPHAASHYAGGDDMLDLDSIGGQLDASKLYGDASLNSITVSGYGSFDQLEVYTVANFNEAFFGFPADFSGIGAGYPPFAVSAGATLVGHLDADKFEGQHGSHYLSRANHTGQEPLSALEQQGHYVFGFDTELLGKLFNRRTFDQAH